jgi:dephospho-CoA kinase
VAPDRADRRAAAAQGRGGGRRPGAIAEHVGSTAGPGLIGKNVVDLLTAADPADVPAIAETVQLGFACQCDLEPWPPERPILEGTFRCAVFLLHCHVVPAAGPDAGQMIAFRDLLRRDPAARHAYAADKRRITAQTRDSLEYTHAKTLLIRRLLGR